MRNILRNTVRWVLFNNPKSKNVPADRNPKWLGLSVIAFVLTQGGAVGAQSGKIPRIGVLASNPLSGNADRIETFKKGLRELGYEEGKTLSLSGDLRRESEIAFRCSRPSW